MTLSILNVAPYLEPSRTDGFLLGQEVLDRSIIPNPARHLLEGLITTVGTKYLRHYLCGSEKCMKTFTLHNCVVCSLSLTTFTHKLVGTMLWKQVLPQPSQQKMSDP